MSDVTVVSFDIGNTLLRLGGAGFCVEFALKTGLPREVLRPLFYEHFLTKRCSLADAVLSLCRVIGFENAQELIDEFRPAPVSLFEDTLPVLEQLKAAGITMIAMSNCTPWEAGGLEALGLGRYLKHVFYSYAIGAAKPDPAMFQYVQTTLDVSPETIVHVGDSRVADVDGARAVGWRAVLLDRAARRTQSQRNCGDVSVITTLAGLYGLLFGGRSVDSSQGTTSSAETGSNGVRDRRIGGVEVDVEGEPDNRRCGQME